MNQISNENSMNTNFVKGLKGTKRNIAEMWVRHQICKTQIMIEIHSGM